MQTNKGEQIMAIRKDNEQTEAPAPASVTHGFFTQVLVLGIVMAFGFVGNSYLTNLHENERIQTEYRGYKDGVKDVR